MKSMERFLTLIVAALVAAGSAWAQEPSPADTAETNEARPAPESRPSHVRRHKMGDKSRTQLEVEREFAQAMERRTKELQDRVAELQKELKEAPSEQVEIRLKALELELQKLQELEAIELPGIVTTEPDKGIRVLIEPGGDQVVILDPEEKRWRKKRGEKVAYFNHVYVDAGEWIDGPAIAILGNVHVTGHVNEDAVSIGGNVYVDGSVDGNVIAPFGEVYLNSDAYVEGDIVAIDVFANDEAIVGGLIEEIPMFHLPWLTGGPGSLYVMLSTVALTKLVLGILVGLLILAVAPTHVVRVEERLRKKPVGSFFGGVLVQILFLPAFILLLATVIGIPLALLALPLIMLVAVLLGFVAFSRILGGAVLKGKDGERPGWLVFIVGAVLLFAPALVGMAMALPDAGANGAFLFVTNLLIFLSMGVLYIVFTAGMGASIFSRLGTRSVPEKPWQQTIEPGPAGPAMPPPPAPQSLPQAPPATDAT